VTLEKRSDLRAMQRATAAHLEDAVVPLDANAVAVIDPRATTSLIHRFG
jgi:hypothetical protein